MERENVPEDKFRYHWEVITEIKQKNIECDIHLRGKYERYLKADSAFNEKLEKNLSDTLADMIRNAAFDREQIAGAIYYNRGFLDGFKVALNLIKGCEEGE